MYLTFIHIKAPIHALSYLLKFFSYSMQIEWNLEKKNVKARQKLYTYTWVDLNILIYPDILIVWEIFSHRTKSVRKYTKLPHRGLWYKENYSAIDIMEG